VKRFPLTHYGTAVIFGSALFLLLLSTLVWLIATALGA
jgi:hypothetical protein